jgi:hypothetical protein
MGIPHRFDEFDDMSPTGAKIVIGVYGGFALYWFFLCWIFSEGYFSLE